MVLFEDVQQLRRLINTVVQSELSDFYRDLYTSIDAEAVSSITDLPFLDRSTLADVHPDDRLYTHHDNVRFVAYTSGTTSGKPMLSYFSTIEDYHLDSAWGSGITRPLIVFPPLNKNFCGTFVQQCAQSPRPVTPVFGDLQNMATNAVLFAEARCDALYATPSYAFALAPELKRFADPAAVKLLIISGETVGEEKMVSLKALYPNATIANLYASSEIGQFIMGPTPEMMASGVQGFVPVKKTLVALELVEGELVVTYALNEAFPLIRYKTGDHFKVSESLTAQYGAGTLVLTWAGKGGVDVVRAVGLEFRTGSVDDFFSTLPQHYADYQLHVHGGDTETGVQLVLEIVSTEIDTTQLALVREAFMEQFIVSKSGTAGQALTDGVIESIEVRFVNEVSVQGKKRRVLVSHL